MRQEDIFEELKRVQRDTPEELKRIQSLSMYADGGNALLEMLRIQNEAREKLSHPDLGPKRLSDGAVKSRP